jgi:hypothetical protein
MGYRYHQVPYPAPDGSRERVGAAEWLDEKRITSTSQVFIQVGFNVFSRGLQGTNLEDFTSEAYEPWRLDQNQTTLMLLPRNYITSAEFDGVQMPARQGRISIIDPEGLWAEAMNHIGFWKNHELNVGRPNMTVYFGWVGLKPDSNGETEMLQEFKAITLKTGFNMDENGVITIEITFIEDTEKILNSIKFNTLSDLHLVNPEINTNIKSFKTIAEVLRYITGTNSESINAQLEKYNIELVFNDTYEKEDSTTFGELWDNFKIRIGDSLSEKINELLARAEPEDPDDENYTYSYEMVKKEQVLRNNIPGTIITFDWRRAPTDRGLENMTSDETRRAFSVGYGAEREPMEGPRLLWKRKSSNSEEKELIQFEVDLKMLDYATSMMKGDLDKKLASFTESNWNDVAEATENLAKSNNPRDQWLLGLDPSELAQHVQREQNGNPSYAVVDAMKNRWFDGRSRDDVERINKITEEFNDILAKNKNNVSGQIATIIRNNVFSAKARIMGDPTFGTVYRQWNMYFTSDFKLVGEFASFFEREWQLAKVTHKIEESGFFTELELLALPVTNV